MKSPTRPPGPGCLPAGDVHTGPWIAIEAVGGGIEAAESIDRYLKGVDMVEGRTEGEEAHKRWAEIPKDEEGAAPGSDGRPAAGVYLWLL